VEGKQEEEKEAHQIYPKINFSTSPPSNFQSEQDLLRAEKMCSPFCTVCLFQGTKKCETHFIIPRRKGSGGYSNSLRPSVRPSVRHFCPEHISKSI
jgi:hypothetical protein